MGGQGGCERRIEVFGKIHEKNQGGSGGGSGGGVGLVGVRMDVNEKLKFFVKIQKEMGGGVSGGRGWVGGSGWGSGWI